ncbi:MAG TPA: hypothetical protein VK025_14720 [Steroidobacter sp.]|jgi:Flp pilus assembly protein TadB|nr:hypothetical protein [Steroidobacteraceae bacterium]HLS82650.1 hypothetical protein [Steroidobacter sp.]
MQFDQERPRLQYRGGVKPRAQAFLARALAATGAIVVLLGAVAVSIVLFVIALSAALVLGAYLWWKTRDLRRQMRSHLAADSDVIEGVVIREVSTRRTER